MAFERNPPPTPVPVKGEPTHRPFREPMPALGAWIGPDWQQPEGPWIVTYRAPPRLDDALPDLRTCLANWRPV